MSSYTTARVHDVLAVVALFVSHLLGARVYQHVECSRSRRYRMICIVIIDVVFLLLQR